MRDKKKAKVGEKRQGNFSKSKDDAKKRSPY